MIKSLKYIPYLLKQYYHISQFEKWNKEKIEKYQINAFQRIFERAKQIPFYKELYKETGVLDAKINSIEDLNVLPMIDKATCRKNGYEDYFLGKDIPGTLINPTSGSTGKPFQVRMPSKIEMIPPIKVVHAMRQFGWKPYYKGLEIWREDISTHKGFMRKTGLLKSISIFQPLEEIKDKIENEKPDFLFCNRTFYAALAEYLQKVNFKYKPKYLLCTAEEVREYHRHFLEKSFETKLINIYGCMESPTIGYSCPEHNQMHIFQTTVIIEVINKRIIEGDEYGDVVMTNLTNDLMPFIRYKIGDVVKVTKGQCKCGRNSQIIGDILGRSDDVIKFKDGRVFNYIHIWQRFRKPILINNAKKIDQYKVWHRLSDDKLIFHFKVNATLNQDQADNLITNILTETFSDIQYEYKIVDEIPLSKSGKFKIIEVID